MSVELDVKFSKSLTKKLMSMKKQLSRLPQEAFNEFKSITPVRSGHAKKNTQLNGTKIEAKYGYAGVLDKGRHMTKRGMRGSKQAPEGMTKPTKEFIRDRLKQIVQGK